MASLGEFGAAEQAADPDREQDTFDYYGDTFTVKDRVPSMPLLRFAAIARAGADATELEGLAAMYDFITACIVPDDRARFERVATDHDADTDELMGICTALYRAATGRPTRRPSASAGGSSTTTESSRETSSSVESLSPIQRDPRVLALVPLEEVGLSLAG